MTMKKSPRRRQAMATVLSDPRWKMLATGRATPEEIADLRAWARENEFAAEAWEACCPTSDTEVAQVADALLRKRQVAKAATVEATAHFAAPQRLMLRRAASLSPFSSTEQPFNRSDTKSRRDEYSEIIDRAIAGDRAAIERFVKTLEPATRRRIAQVLWNAGTPSNGDIDDVLHEVVLSLFSNGGKVLKSWDPSHGSIQSFVGVVAKQAAENFLQKSRRSLSGGFKSPEAVSSRSANERTPEQVAIHRELVKKFASQLSEKERLFFKMSMIDELPTNELCAQFAMTEAAAHQWRSRLASRFREMVRSMDRADATRILDNRKSRIDGGDVTDEMGSEVFEPKKSKGSSGDSG